MPQVFVFEKKLYKAETNGSKMIKSGAKCLQMVAMRRSRCDQDITQKLEGSKRHLFSKQSLKAAKGCCIASKA